MVRSVSVSPDTMVYPSSDGLPMAETDFQRRSLMYAVDALDVYFQDREDVYVSGNLFIYYEEGNPKAVVAPDVFVVIGTGKYDRPSRRSGHKYRLRPERSLRAPRLSPPHRSLRSVRGRSILCLMKPLP
jgi:hypothetical protein